MKGATSRFLWNSVKSKLILLVAISYTAFISMLIYNSVQNISLSWDKFSELNENIMALHSHNLDVMLAANNEYLIALSPTAFEFGQEEADNFEASTSSMEYLRPRIHLMEEMKNAIGQGVLIDGIFFLFPRYRGIPHLLFLRYHLHPKGQDQKRADPLCGRARLRHQPLAAAEICR